VAACGFLLATRTQEFAMKTLLAAAAVLALSAPAFAIDNSPVSTTTDKGASQYGATASIADNQRANAASSGNVALTRGPDDPRYEGSPDTPKTWAQARGQEDLQVH
jgi:hypothetical protein